MLRNELFTVGNVWVQFIPIHTLCFEVKWKRFTFTSSWNTGAWREYDFCFRCGNSPQRNWSSLTEQTSDFWLLCARHICIRELFYIFSLTKNMNLVVIGYFKLRRNPKGSSSPLCCVSHKMIERLKENIQTLFFFWCKVPIFTFKLLHICQCKYCN